MIFSLGWHQRSSLVQADSMSGYVMAPEIFTKDTNFNSGWYYQPEIKIKTLYIIYMTYPLLPSSKTPHVSSIFFSSISLSLFPVPVFPFFPYLSAGSGWERAERTTRRLGGGRAHEEEKGQQPGGVGGGRAGEAGRKNLFVYDLW